MFMNKPLKATGSFNLLYIVIEEKKRLKVIKNLTFFRNNRFEKFNKVVDVLRSIVRSVI